MSLGCFGSAKGIWIASSQAVGVISSLWKEARTYVALPDTQGFYGFICAIMIVIRTALAPNLGEMPELLDSAFE